MDPTKLNNEASQDAAQVRLRSAFKGASPEHHPLSGGGSPITTFAPAPSAPPTHDNGSFPSSSTNALRVSVVVEPSSVADAASSPATVVPPDTQRHYEESAVAQLLADLGVSAPHGGGSSSSSGTSPSSHGALAHLRPLLVRTAGLLLARKPACPERFLIDHVSRRYLSTTAVASPLSSSPAVAMGKLPASTSDLLSQNVDSDTDGRTCSAASNAPGDGVVATDGGGGSGTRLHSGGHSRGSGSSGPPQPLMFAPVGDTVAERLAFAAPIGIGRGLLNRVAKLLLDVKPQDPEMFLWTKFDSRSFSEDVAASTMVTFGPDGFPMLPPDDPTQAALLREVPISSPGYAVAAALLPLVFAKKPDDPINYLFLHLTSRARSSVAGSVRSSSKGPQRFGEEDNISYTSRDLGDYDEENDHDDGDVDGDVDDELESTRDDLSTEKDAVVRVFLSNLQRKGSGGGAGALLRSSGGGGGTTTRSRRRSMHSNASNSCSGRVTHTVAPAVPYTYHPNSRLAGIRVAGDASPSSSSIMNTNNNLSASSGAKRVCIAGEPSDPLPSTTTTTTTTTAAAAAAGLGIGNFFPTFHSSPTAAAAAATATTTPAIGGESMQHLREEVRALRLRDVLRMERTRYEIEVLRREREHLLRLALYDSGDHALLAARAATTALEEAERHLRFLDANHTELTEQIIPRQLRTMEAATVTATAAAAYGRAPQQQQPLASEVSAAALATMQAELERLRRRVDGLSSS